MKKLIIWNGQFSYQYILDGKIITLENFVVENASKLGIEVIRKGDGTRSFQDKDAKDLGSRC